MSSEALAWAFKQDIKPSSVKFTLVALCECANYKTGLIFPSIAHLSDITGQDRKTLIFNIAELERRGFITDTGERSGTTKQIKVYSAALGTVPSSEPSQKRNSSKSPQKQSQKRDTEPSREPSSSEAKASSDKRAKPAKFEFACPEGVDPMDWSALIDNRKAKRAALSEGAHRQIIAKLKTWSRAGWPPGPIVAHAAERGWTTVFETDEMKGPRNGSGSRPVQQTADGRSMGRTEAAGRGAYEKLAASGNFRVGSQTGPALAGGNHSGALALSDPDRPHRHVAGR